MLCLVHGYGLSVSGSNLWTREVVRALVRNGETVHLVCQSGEAESLDFVAEAFRYDAAGEPESLFSRRVPYPGRCVLHRPWVDVLPTYVRPRNPDPSVVAIPELGDEAIRAYLSSHEAALRTIVERHGIRALHVNHVVLLAEVARRLRASHGLPFVLMPHGSALEYVVKQDPRMRELARGIVGAADRILTQSRELQERVLSVFADVPGLEAKMIRVAPGVDVDRFRLLDRDRRGESLRALAGGLAGRERGRTPEQTAALATGLRDDLTLPELRNLLRQAARYRERCPDADLEAKLEALDPERQEVVAFFGRLLGHKGVADVAAALPQVLAARPRARAVIAGGGPMREPVEAFLGALAAGHRALAWNLVAWGAELEGQEAEPFSRVAPFFQELERRGELDRYFATAREQLTPGRVVFTGYLEHDLLQHLLPCCDAGVFPSHVPEAGPMVAVEAMASGCFPAGTDTAGMASILDATAASGVPEEVVALGRLSPEPARTVADVAERVPRILEIAPRWRRDLRRVAEERFDWRSVASAIARHLRELAGEEPAPGQA